MTYPYRTGPLTGPSPVSGPNFGSGTALSADGLVMAVGMSGYSTGGTNIGAVAMYQWVSGAWSFWQLVTNPGGAAQDRFGTSVALSADGAVLAVGAPNNATSVGIVKVFDLSAGTYTHRGSFTAQLTGTFQFFGQSVALSADGLIIAVGKPGATSNRGLIEIRVWNGSSWVLRQSLQPADQANNDYFGYGVALSADGVVLCAGAYQWEGPTTDQGGVYTFDWSGTAYVQRGSVLTRTGAATGDRFGDRLALTADGEILAVGAIGVGSFTGEAIIYTRSGSAWTLDETITAPDAATGDQFGSVALSGDGYTLVIGAPAWEGTNSNQGSVYTYGPTPPQRIVCPSTLIIVESPRIVCPARLTVINPAYRASCPARLSVVGVPARIDCPARLSVVAITAGIQQPPRWTARCLIDGVDMSASLIDTLRVQGAEGGARIASVQIQPATGTVLPLAWVGKPIILDYVPVFGGVGVPQRLFTGRIDTPEYDFATGTLSLRCTDDLQNRVAALDLDAITTLVGGRYTAAVQGEIDDRWDYAQARLTTVAGSLDASPAGALRTTPWEFSTVWATFTQAMLIDGSTRVSYPQRSTMINQVAVEFDYRYARLRERRSSMGWSGTNLDMAPTGWQYPSQQDVVAAANGTGWTVLSGVFYPAPAAIPHTSGGFIYPAQNSIDMAILHVGQRHSQTVTEAYRCTVSAPESVAQNGVLPGSVRGALESAFDGQAWESAFDVAPLMPGGGEQDYAPDATRSDADYALSTLLDQARVKILGSHRSTRITASTVCLPALDMDKRVAIDTLVAGDEINAEGKVVEVEHVLNLRAGTAITNFSIACFGAGGAGILTPDTLDVPDAPAPAAATQDWPSAVPSLFVSTPYSNTYTDNLMGLLLNTPATIFVEDVPVVGTLTEPNPYYSGDVYPVEGFRVRMPGVVDADRNPITLPAGRDYALIVPADPLIITKA